MPGSSFAEVSDDGVTYLVRTPHAEHDYIQKWLVERGTPYEAEMLRDLRAIAPPGALVLDVGANVGNHTLNLAVVGALNVVAYEPSAELAAALHQSIAANRVEGQVRIRAVAVSSGPGVGVIIGVDPKNLGTQKVVMAGDGAGDVPVVYLDDEKFDQSVIAIKIDVEGAELDVLRGAERLLRTDRPAIFVECGESSDFRRVHRFLTARGYHLAGSYNVTPTHLYMPRLETVLERISSQSLERYISLRYAAERSRAKTTRHRAGGAQA